MNTHFIPLSHRTHLLHTTNVLAATQPGEQGKTLLSPSDRSLTRLQRARLAAEEATDPYFKGKKPLIGQTVSDLKGGKITPWHKIMDAKLIFMSQKAMEAAFRKILREIERERVDEYIQECRRQLKERFRQFHAKIQEKQVDLKKLQAEEHIKKKSL